MICALVIAVLGCPILLFQTEVLWDMTSPNAQTWNATLNASATFGINIIPLLIIIIVVCILVFIVAGFKGF